MTTKLTVAAQTALWGLLAALTGPRTAIGIAGLLLLATPLLLPRKTITRSTEKAATSSHAGNGPHD